MPFRLKISLAILALLVVVIFGAPLLVAPGAPAGVEPLAAVAGPDAEYIEVDGVELHVVRQRPAAGAPAASASGAPLFLLLHGFPFSTETFDDLAPLLAGSGEVVAVDLPGFGLSERPLDDDLEDLASRGLDPYSPAGQVRLVRGLLAELGAGTGANEEGARDGAPDDATQVILVGSDSGARLALDVALALGSEPYAAEEYRLGGLVLIGASPYVSSQRSWLARALMNTPQLNRLGPIFLRQIAQEPGLRILRAGWSDPTAIEQEDFDAFQRAWTVEGWDDALWKLTKAEAPPSLEGALGAVAAPALVVAGEEDGVVPSGESERLATELPNATLRLLPGCGHAVQEECPRELAQLIDDWFEGLR